MTEQQKRSFDINQVTLAGRVGRSDLRNTTNGHTVLSFSVATTDYVEGKEYTSWTNCCVWGRYGEMLASSVVKGARVIVLGKLRSRSYEKDGQKREAVEVVSDKVVVDSGGGTRAASQTAGADNSGGNSHPFDDPLPI